MKPPLTLITLAIITALISPHIPPPQTLDPLALFFALLALIWVIAPHPDN